MAFAAGTWAKRLCHGKAQPNEVVPMLRLTLRTLLAYLDDTLDPAQTKDIGRKVAESEVAQETVERIKTVTRRRRLSAPGLTQNPDTEPNTIAEYLDNILPSDQLAEVETAALEQDILLAEVAACHQILTLVLGEPAKVPPTARVRMYKLVKGPESIPYRKPVAINTLVAGVTPPSADEVRAEEELLTEVLGPKKVYWVLGSLALLGVLGFAVWMAIPAPPNLAQKPYVPIAVGDLAKADVKPAPEVVEPKIPPVEVPKVDTNPPMPPVPAEEGPAPRELQEGPAILAPKEPDSERRGLATLVDVPADPLLALKRETTRWERALTGEKRLASSDTLMALAGFHPEIVLESGIQLQLWGNVSEYLNIPMSDSRVTLHIPAQGIDADLTLHDGRIFIKAPKATRPMVVRVRFLDEIWDLTIKTPQTEIALDRINEPARGPLFAREIPESPRTLVYLGVLEGEAWFQAGLSLSAELKKGAKYKWDSKAGRAGLAPKDDPDEAPMADRWSRRVPTTPAARDATEALKVLSKRVVTGQGTYDVDFDAAVKDTREPLPQRVLATTNLGSINSLTYLINALESESAPVREAACRAARHSVSQSETGEEDFLKVLEEKSAFTDEQRKQVIALLRLPDKSVVLDDLFSLLRNEKLAIRELAHQQLLKLDPIGAKESNYDANGNADMRDMHANTWQRSWKKREMAK
jgi:hypothetical protein